MLARLRKAAEEREGGFTLIELLVVMIIIGILAAIAIPLFLSQRKNGFDASIKSDLRTIAIEMESMYTNNQAYPATLSQSGQSVTLAGDTQAVRVSPGNTFTLVVDTAGSAYCLQGTNTQDTHDWTYISNQGGLQPAATTTCPAAGAF